MKPHVLFAAIFTGAIGVVALSGCANSSGTRFSKDMTPTPVPIYITSIGGGFPVEAVLDGTYEVHRDYIELNFRSAELRYVGYGDVREPKIIRKVTVGLATFTAEPKWKSLNMTDTHWPERTMQLRQMDRATIGSVRIPIGE